MAVVVTRYPSAVWNPIRGYPGLPFVLGVPFRGVLHSTEVPGPYRPRSDGSYFGGASPPHFTVDSTDVFQHVDTSLGSYAVENRVGGVETNREGCIQIEIMGRAVEAPDWPADVYTNLVKLMRWVEATHGVAARYIDEGHYYPPEDGIRLDGREPWRIGFGVWPSVDCWVGHCHAPENLHGDPGKVRLDLLFPTKIKPPTVGEDEMARYVWFPSWSRTHQDGPFVGQRPVVVVDEATGRLRGRSGCTFEPRDLAVADGAGDFVVDVSNGPLKGGVVLGSVRDGDTVTFVTEAGQYALTAVEA